MTKIKRQTLEFQADRIEAVLARHRVSTITPPDLRAFVIGARLSAHQVYDFQAQMTEHLALWGQPGELFISPPHTLLIFWPLSALPMRWIAPAWEARKASKRASKPKRPSVQPGVQSTVQDSVQTGQRVGQGGRVQDVQDADLDAVNAQRAATKEENLDRMLDILLDTPDIGATELAGHLNVSRSTVYNYQAELEAAGRIRKNGQGLEVVQ